MKLIFVLMMLVPAGYAIADSELGSSGGSDGTSSTTYFQDLSGETQSAVPRLIRNLGRTEVFFENLNQSYFIHSGLSHNTYFDAIVKAQKEGRKLSIQVDPVTRDILAVDGVNGVSAARKPGSEEVDADDGADKETPKKRRRKKAIDPRKATTTTGWID